MIGGAMKMASKMLDPPTKLSDLKNQKSEIEKSIETSTEVVRIALKKEVVSLENEIKDEMARYHSSIRNEIQTSFREMSSELKGIEADIAVFKDLVEKTYYLILDQRHREGLEKLEATYKTFLHVITCFFSRRSGFQLVTKFQL